VLYGSRQSLGVRGDGDPDDRGEPRGGDRGQPGRRPGTQPGTRPSAWSSGAGPGAKTRTARLLVRPAEGRERGIAANALVGVAAHGEGSDQVIEAGVERT
jgi:hypothetical protein